MPTLALRPAECALVVIDPLRRRGVRTILLCGMNTSIGVERTARDADGP